MKHNLASVSLSLGLKLDLLQFNTSLPGKSF